VVGSSITKGKKAKEEQPKHEPIYVPPQTPWFGAATTSSPPSDGTSSEHYDDPGSPLGQPNDNTFTNMGHHMHSHMLWLAGHCSGTKAATILI
jgi:hypothetical protein